MRRALAVLFLDAGQSIDVIKDLTDLGRRKIFLYRRLFVTEGLTGIAPKRQKARALLLTKAQRAEVVLMLQEQTPQAFGYEEAYWTTQILGAVIKEKYSRPLAKVYYDLLQMSDFLVHRCSLTKKVNSAYCCV